MPDAVKTVSIRDFGAAEGNTAAENAAAIQRAIDEARERGIPSRVVVPPGTFSTGTLRLRSHVELHLEKGAVLKASTCPKDYNANDAFPENFWNDNEEWSGGHLLLGYKVEDVAQATALW